MKVKLSSVVVLMVCLGSLAQTDPETKQKIRAEIATVEALLPKLADGGPGLYTLAADYSRLGDSGRALDLLKRCLLLDEGFNPNDDPAFQQLRQKSEFQSLSRRLSLRYPVVQKSHVVLKIPEKDLIPEGLAVDGATRTFYIGSLLRKKIVKILSNGEISDFAAAGRRSWGPVCGIKVDGADHSVWANTCSDLGDGAELLHFDARGRVIGRFAAVGIGKHLFNDLVLRGESEIYLTDSLANVVYRFDRGSGQFTTVSLAREIYYPNGIALSNDGKRLYVADAFGILRVNLEDKSSEEVQPGPSNTLAAVDGLYWYRNGLVAVQNEMGLLRVIRIELSADGVHTIRLRILEDHSALVRSPTTGAILSSNFYFICNSQIDNMKDDKVIDERKLEPVQIAAVPIRN